MARINADLLFRLRRVLGLSTSQVYRLIEAKVRASHLPRNLAAIALASEHNVNISKYAKPDDLATIRQTAVGSAPRPVVVPAAAVGPVGRRGSRGARQRRAETRRRGTSVFVVHGRNEKARKALFAFLRALGLEPLEWIQAIKKTRKASPYVGEILETAFREAAAVVVLLTADDDARLKVKFQKPSDPAIERVLSGQARPNVLFEAGMAFGKNPDSTVLVQMGDVKSFSDVGGRHVVRLSNNPTARQELATKLANAGCNVNTTGTDWLEEGDLSA